MCSMLLTVFENRRSRMWLSFVTITAVGAICGPAQADWRQFRGSDTSAVGQVDAIPLEWSADKNVAWKSAIPGRGLSSPIVIGDKVFITSCSGYRQDRLHVLCFSSASGELEWERQFWATGRTMSHPKTCNAAPTPASDGERVFALFSSADLVCLDLEGNLLWFRGLMVDFPNASNSLGMASSPIVAGNTLIVPLENDSQSVTLGVDPATGLTRWSKDRPKKANWTSPVVMPGASPADDVVLLQSSAGIHAVDPATGEELWSFGKGASTIPSSIVHGQTVFVPSNGITALKLNSGSANPEQLWQVERLSPGTGSPLVYQDQLLVISRAGVLLSADLDTGETKWQQRLEGPFSGSPVAAAGHLIVFNERGVGQIVDLKEAGKVVSTNDLGESILCTPAISGNAIFVRSDEHVWKLAVSGSR
jgi:outer membrane protein assembly factor BamB